MSASPSLCSRYGPVLAAAACILGLTGCQATDSGPAQQTASSQLERGHYLVVAGGCGDCHTPLKMGPKGPEPDLSRTLSGHPEQLVMPPPPALGDTPWMWVGAATNTAFAGPWGISYAINLTSDEETGLGVWSEEMFVTALRTGKHFGGGRPIMPPMPWQNYSHLTDDDLKAIFAYLKTVPPIVNHVPEWQPPPAPSSPGD